MADHFLRIRDAYGDVLCTITADGAEYKEKLTPKQQQIVMDVLVESVQAFYRSAEKKASRDG